jgi:hypothetical protein
MVLQVLLTPALAEMLRAVNPEGCEDGSVLELLSELDAVTVATGRADVGSAIGAEIRTPDGVVRVTALAVPKAQANWKE